MRTYLVVSGLPGSGKTTLAAALSKLLSVNHLDKDEFLESHFNDKEVLSAEDRKELSRLADNEFRIHALACQAAVLSSWWRHPQSLAKSGTPVTRLHDVGVQVKEVHCICPVALAVGRFERRLRHPGHLDRQRTHEQLLEQFTEAEALGPLFPASARLCNTATPVSASTIEALASDFRQFKHSTSEA